MGLDSFVMKLTRLDDEDLKKLEGVHLCGGMFSGHGFDGSFRGKVYADAVSMALDLDLYEPVIDGNTIHDHMVGKSEKEMLDALAYHMPGHEDEAYDLYKLLRTCADEGWCLVSWY